MYKKLSLVFGVCDLATGVALMLCPSFVMTILMTEVAAESLVYIRYIGVFVFAVGFAYFLPYLPVKGRKVDVWSVWNITALVRCFVAAFVLLQVVISILPTAWLLVAVVDGSIASAQFVLLRKMPPESL